MADNKPDVAHEMTDKMLRRLEKRVAKEYNGAYKTAKKRLDEYLEQFARADKEKLEQVKNGIITEKEYKTWRLNKIAVGKRWQSLVNTLAQDYTNANKIAAGIINNDLNDVFALNANYIQYEIEKSGYSTGTSFTLYDRNTVALLIKEQPDLLPKANIDIPKDLKWNSKKITSAVTQGLLAGESIQKIANRLQSVTTMNKVSAIRNARTAVTAAENAGRQERYNEFADKDLPLRKRWIATIDGRTRHAHAMADGQTVGLKEPFNIDGYDIMYPGDKSAPGYLVYNCRCTTRTVEKDGIEAEPRERRIKNADGTYSIVKDMTYQQWEKQKQAERQGKTGKSAQAGDKVEKNTVKPQKTNNQEYNRILEELQKQGVEYNPVKILTGKQTEIDIIRKISGGDDTDGSCASLALAYIGQKQGLNVLDFRGGVSREYFSSKMKKFEMFKALGTHPIEESSAKTDLTNGKRALQKMVKGKEYYFSVGKHATIVRLNDKGKRQYLELQSGITACNGWQDFGEDVGKTLKERFGCKPNSSYWNMAYLTDIEEFPNNEEFKTLLGFINTDEAQQMKGNYDWIESILQTVFQR